jgi:hypothetical protein
MRFQCAALVRELFDDLFFFVVVGKKRGREFSLVGTNQLFSAHLCCLRRGFWLRFFDDI